MVQNADPSVILKVIKILSTNIGDLQSVRFDGHF